MSNPGALAEVAAAIGDPARAAMLAALMGGERLDAGELARLAGVTPQTASGHLARLVAAGLVVAERSGRRRLHRIASAEVASVLEGLMALAATLRPVATPPLRAARTCYDHLAGQFGVALSAALLAPVGDELTPWGVRSLERLGIDLQAVRRGPRTWCRPCLDWSERVPHVAGGVGAALCARCFELGWVRRIPGTRAVTVTPEGRRGAREIFGV